MIDTSKPHEYMGFGPGSKWQIIGFEHHGVVLRALLKGPFAGSYLEIDPITGVSPSDSDFFITKYVPLVMEEGG